MFEPFDRQFFYYLSCYPMLEAQPLSNTSGVALPSQATENLVFDSVENIGGHYSRTLSEWREDFLGTFHDRIAHTLRKEQPGMRGEDVNVFKRKRDVNTLFSSSYLSPRKPLQDLLD